MTCSNSSIIMVLLLKSTYEYGLVTPA